MNKINFVNGDSYEYGYVENQPSLDDIMSLAEKFDIESIILLLYERIRYEYIPNDRASHIEQIIKESDDEETHIDIKIDWGNKEKHVINNIENNLSSPFIDMSDNLIK